jgi:two-component system nitrate/nitrite response regulator NarL
MSGTDPVIKILIADDHPIFRHGLTRLLSNEKGFNVVGKTGYGSEVVGLVEKLQPDILLLDLVMPDVNGMDILRSLAEIKHNVRTILLSGVVEIKDIPRAFELGASGLVLKDCPTTMLCEAIQGVMAGQYWIGRQPVANLVQELKRYRKSLPKAPPKDYGLTPREKEILKLVVYGFSNNDIADRLSISLQTVKHHITNIFDKLGVYNRLELSLFAFHHGLAERD